MFYTVYKVTNILNGKYYIGKHQTKDLDDGYMGSGKLIRRAIRKHGLENFKKEILHVFANERDMNLKEAELVVVSEETYNLCEGDKGGWSYINNNDDIKKKRKLLFIEKNKDRLSEIASVGGRARSKIGYKHSEKTKSIIRNANTGKNNHFHGKKHSEESLKKMRKSKNVGSNNSQYGTCWITNGQENKKIPKDALDKWLEMGYHKGRV